MKKLLLVAMAIALLAAALPNAMAQDGITLGTSLTNSLSFAGLGAGNFSMNWANRGLITQGHATGTGPDLAGPSSCGSGIPCVGAYKFIQNSSITANLTTPGCGATCNWSYSMASNALLFDFGPIKGGNTGQWLNGDVQLVNFTQLAGGGLFHDTITADLTSLKGILAQYFPGGALLNLTLSFTTGQDLSKLGLGHGSDGVAGGDVSSQTPEPGTMALLGSGALFVGAYLRKRAKKI